MVQQQRILEQILTFPGLLPEWLFWSVCRVVLSLEVEERQAAASISN